MKNLSRFEECIFNICYLTNLSEITENDVRNYIAIVEDLTFNLTIEQKTKMVKNLEERLTFINQIRKN